MMEYRQVRRVLNASSVTLDGATVLVEELECEFLEGNYRHALYLANQFLERERGKRPETGETIRLKSMLRFDRYYLEVIILCGESKADLVHRAAAVALQCWYELARQAHGRDRRDGWKFLQPFYDTYSNRAMPIQLFLLLVRLSQSLMELDQNVEAVAECLNRIQHICPDSSPEIEIVRELWGMLLLDILPFLRSTAATKDVLGRIAESTEDWPPSVAKWKISDKPFESNVRQVLNFVEKTGEDAKFPVLRAIQDTLRGKLESYLNEANVVTGSTFREFEDASSGDSVLAYQSMGWRYTGKDFNAIFITFLKRIQSFWRERVIHPLLRSEESYSNQRQLAISILVLWISWRQRERLVATSRKVLVSSLLKPLNEIVEALLPASR